MTATGIRSTTRDTDPRRREVLSSNELADGGRFAALTVIDLCTRECLPIDVGHGLCGRDVVATLERLRFERGVPQRIYRDNGH